jgi:hypothetical protein
VNATAEQMTDAQGGDHQITNSPALIALPSIALPAIRLPAIRLP